MFLIFENKTKADTVLNEVCVTPFGMTWMWYNPDVETNDIQYAYDWQEIRCCVCHNFSEEDRAWLEIYLDGVAGVTIADVLPDDWYETPVYPEVIVTE